ncbi:MAG: PAS domain S-box protein [Deltaproteobacteria bacterium]|nr:PAS domain S-box protein [Deltaproteobacteria bacterium]
MTAIDDEIFLFSPVGIVVNSLEGNFCKANYAYLEMMGYSTDRLAGKNFKDFTHPEVDKKADELFEQFISRTKTNGKISIRTKTATDQWIWISVNARIIRNENGAPAFFIAFVEDISQQKYEEEKQARLLEEINALLEATRIALQADDFIDAAHSLFEHCRILVGAGSGYVALLSKDKNQDEILFSEDGGLECSIPMNAHMSVGGFVADAYKTGRPVYQNEFNLSEHASMLPEGHISLQNILFAPLMEKGESLGMMGFAQKRKGFSVRDAQIAGAFADLVAIVVKRSQLQCEHQKMQIAIIQSDRLSSMGRLAAGICHELNNPLSYVGYSIESLKDDFAEMTKAAIDLEKAENQNTGTGWQAVNRIKEMLIDDDIQKRLSLATEGLCRIREIASALGAFSLSEKEAKRSVSIDSVIEAAINMAMYEIKYRAKLTREFTAVSPVMASPGRLAQGFLNLLMNAVESIEPGKVMDSEIKLKTWQQNGHVFFEISDTGRGISKDRIDNAFEPFYTSKGNTATGLGLPICKQIVSELNGEIRLESIEGRGTTVTMQIPIHEKSITDYVKSQLDTCISNRFVQGRILLVDDEDGIRLALHRILRKHKTEDAASGKDAIELLQKDHNFDMILCDLVMPQTTGIDVHKWILANVPELADDMVFMTGGVFTDDAKQYLATYDPPVISKPFDHRTLAQFVNDRVAERHLTKTN